MVLRKGQSDLMTAMILVSATLTIGLAFSALAMSQVSNIVSRGRMQQLLMSEQANLVLYREVENESSLCVGILRITPSVTNYALALLLVDASTGLVEQDLLEQGGGVIERLGAGQPNIVPERVPASSVYLIYRGDYYTVPMKSYVYIVRVPQDIIQNYVTQQRPFLVCISKEAIADSIASAIGEGGAKVVKLIVLTHIGSDLYEVGEWSAYP